MSKRLRKKYKSTFADNVLTAFSSKSCQHEKIIFLVAPTLPCGQRAKNVLLPCPLFDEIVVQKWSPKCFCILLVSVSTRSSHFLSSPFYPTRSTTCSPARPVLVLDKEKITKSVVGICGSSFDTVARPEHLLQFDFWKQHFADVRSAANTCFRHVNVLIRLLPKKTLSIYFLNVL